MLFARDSSRTTGVQRTLFVTLPITSATALRAPVRDHSLRFEILSTGSDHDITVTVSWAQVLPS